MTMQELMVVLEALECSHPTHHHYSEPKERHALAINIIKAEIAKQRSA